MTSVDYPKFNALIKRHLRRLFTYWPPRAELRRNAHKGPSGYYLCQDCCNYFPRQLTHVDHIEPVVDPIVGFVDWNTYISRMYVSIEKLRILCKSCHKVKTKRENAQRHLNKTGAYSKESASLISKANKGHTYLRGIPKTANHIKAMSKSRKGFNSPARYAGQLKTAKSKNKRVTAISVLSGEETIFESVIAASRQLNISSANISKVCRGIEGRMQAGGYRFKWTS